MSETATYAAGTPAEKPGVEKAFPFSEQCDCFKFDILVSDIPG